MTTPSDPLITCPHCKSDIRLTESLAAPLVDATRRQYEDRLRDKEAEFVRREAEIQAARGAIDRQVAEKLASQRAAIVEEEARRARLAITGELEQRTRELADLNAVLEERDKKLAEAQTAQAEAIRKIGRAHV